MAVSNMFVVVLTHNVLSYAELSPALAQYTNERPGERVFSIVLLDDIRLHVRSTTDL